MNRLINEDALIDALMSYTWRDEDGFEIHDAEEKREYIREWLPSLPAIDAVPVVRGKWIDESVVTETSNGWTTYNRQYRCSVCGNLFGRVDDRYCGRCGAKMDEERKGNA